MSDAESALRRKTMQAVFEHEVWLTLEDIAEADDWRRQGRVFAVVYEGTEYFPRYQFDDAYEPLPVIKDILQALGEVDAWTFAAWFHYPSGWIADAVDGAKPVAPKDALNRRDDVLAAARRTRGTYVA